MRILILKTDLRRDDAGRTKTAAGDLIVTVTPASVTDQPALLRGFGADLLIHDGVTKDDFHPDAWTLVRCASVGALRVSIPQDESTP